MDDLAAPDRRGKQRTPAGSSSSPLAATQLWLLIRKLQQGPTADKVVSLAINRYSPLQVDKKVSLVYKRQHRQCLHRTITDFTLLRNTSITVDGIILPQRDTFFNCYKVLYLNLLPSKTKETTFQTLNRTTWMHNKSFKSGMVPCCEKPETMEQLLFVRVNLLSHDMGTGWSCSYFCPLLSYGRLHSIHSPYSLEIMYNKPGPTCSG